MLGMAKKGYVSAIASFLLFLFISSAIILRQESFLISGSTVFSGLFHSKVYSYFGILFAIFIIAVISTLLSLVIQKQLKFDRSLSSGSPVDGKSLELFGLGNIKKAVPSAAAFSLFVLFFSQWLEPNRWVHNGASSEQYLYFILLSLVYLGSFLLTGSLWKAAIFPAAAFSFLCIKFWTGEDSQFTNLALISIPTIAARFIYLPSFYQKGCLVFSMNTILLEG